jgi:hypothetical protein
MSNPAAPRRWLFAGGARSHLVTLMDAAILVRDMEPTGTSVAPSALAEAFPPWSASDEQDATDRNVDFSLRARAATSTPDQSCVGSVALCTNTTSGSDLRIFRRQTARDGSLRDQGRQSR